MDESQDLECCASFGSPRNHYAGVAGAGDGEAVDGGETRKLTTSMAARKQGGEARAKKQGDDSDEARAARKHQAELRDRQAQGARWRKVHFAQEIRAE
ncbi:uncharacterized protein SCHCODRAFT_01088824 [Schizophyllum commune H4-8]|nr:uncharacterized protein SCHCODRAFT_01088824 [Schizophyllum commune H4-8]KAI5895687.1 hypothetical protein SCHCODRAFT_01088824 [Schizophyllum commune H4-8]